MMLERNVEGISGSRRHAAFAVAVIRIGDIEMPARPDADDVLTGLSEIVFEEWIQIAGAAFVQHRGGRDAGVMSS